MILKEYKPVVVNVINSVKQVLPSTNPGLVASSWEASTAYSLNDVVITSTGQYLWCTVAGTSDATTEPEQTDGDGTVADNDITWTAVHVRRDRLYIKNTDATHSISLGFGTDAVDGSGVVLAPGEVFEDETKDHDHPCFGGVVNAICSDAGGANVSIQEW